MLVYIKIPNANAHDDSLLAEQSSLDVPLSAESAALYEIQLVAFNGNGDSPENRRLVSLTKGGNGSTGMTFELSLRSMEHVAAV